MDNLFEGMISIRAIIESKSRKIEKVYYAQNRKQDKPKEYAWLLHRAKEGGFEIEICDKSSIDEICGGKTHGGIAALCSKKEIDCLKQGDLADDGFYLYLDGIEDPYNFGFAIRSAYAAGVNGIILSSRNWMDVANIVCKSSAGASERIPTYKAEDESFIDLFKEKNYKVYAAEIKDSSEMTKTNLKKPLLLCIGGEKRGISRAILDKCDANVRIDYARDFDEALSAASATAILCFEVVRQNRD